MLPVKKDHVEQGLRRLPSVWGNSPKVKGLLTSYLKEIQQVEDVLFDLLEDRSINTAIGQQLDNLGDLLGEKRNGRTDEEYRDYLRSLPLVFRSGATINELLNILERFSNADNVGLWEHPPAFFFMHTDGTINPTVMNTIHMAKAAGVRYAIMFDQNDSLVLGGENNVVYKVLNQFSDWDQTGLVFQDEARDLITENDESYEDRFNQSIYTRMLSVGTSDRFITSDLGEGLCTDIEVDTNYLIETEGFSEGVQWEFRDGSTTIEIAEDVNGSFRITTRGTTDPKLCLITTELGGKFIGNCYIKQVINNTGEGESERTFLPDLPEITSDAINAPISGDSSVQGIYDPFGVMTFDRDTVESGYDYNGDPITFQIDEPRLEHDSGTGDFLGLYLVGNATESDEDKAEITNFDWITQSGAWVMEISNANVMEDILLFDGTPLLEDVSGSGYVVILLNEWQILGIWVDSTLTATFNSAFSADFQNLTSVSLADQVSGEGYIKEFYFDSEITTEQGVNNISPNLVQTFFNMWILTDGSWDDNYVWDDAETWNDN